MHLRYSQMSLIGWPWPTRALSYDATSDAREARVELRAEADRALLLGAVQYIGKPNGRGRTVVRDVVVRGVALMRGDRVVPSPRMLDTSVIDEGLLPLRVLFWRPTRNAQGLVVDAVVNRCPLFSPELGTSPSDTLAIDTLHTVNYGPMMRFTTAAIWRVLLLNPWGFVGNQDARMELCVRRLRTHLFAWYQTRGVPAEKRLGDLTLAMLGPSLGHGFGDLENPHPGCMAKSKAAETAMLMDWAIDLLRDYEGVPYRSELLAAGVALRDWAELTARAPLRLPISSQQQLCDLALRHLTNAQRARIDLVPKHHFFAHLACASGRLGNPRAYSTFLDESLNLMLRTVTAAAHRAKQAWRILHSFHLIGKMNLSPYIYGAGD